MRRLPSKTGLILTCVFLHTAISAAAAERAPGLELQLAGGSFRPGDARPSGPAWYRNAERRWSPSGNRYPVLMTGSSLTEEQRRSIERAGARILDYVPVHGYRLRLPGGSEDRVRDLPFVQWLGDLPAHMKISPGLSGQASHGVGPARVRAVLFAGESGRRAMEILGAFDPVAAPSGMASAWRIAATVPGSRLAGVLSALAGLPEVEAVEEARHIRPLNNDARWVHQSFVLDAKPIFDEGIFGCDQIVAVADTGQDHDACQFADPVLGDPPISECTTVPCPSAVPDLNQRKDIIYYNWSGSASGDDDTCPGFFSSGHGTHTSGTVAGDSPPYVDCVSYTSAADDVGDGVATGAQLVIEEMGDFLEYLNDYQGTVWNLADVAYQTGASILSISWGGVCHDLLGGCIPGCTLPYDSLARDADLAMWTYPELLIVKSAGNAGDFCSPPVAVSTPAIAKNLLTVGSVGHGLSADTPSSFSSRGPVFDGRLKPTVSAQGENTESAASDPLTVNGCATCALSGTSMAAPTAAGMAALVREYFTAGYHAAGYRDPNQGTVPSGALLKAMMIDGAVALGPSAPEPDFDAGFGRVLLNSTLRFDDSAFDLFVNDHPGLTTGGLVTHAFDVSAGEALRATLVWTDPPAALNAAVARVNELKLEAIDPNGNVWFQTLDPVSGLPAQTMNGADPHDTLNVEERLVFTDPQPGRWVFRVHGVDVAWGPQPFALVVRGGISPCAAPAAPVGISLGTPSDQEVQVSWDPVPGAAAYNVYRSLGECPGGAWVPAAQGLTESSFLDSGLSGDTAYSYRTVATSDATAHCESEPSSCDSVVPSGNCTLEPEFGGILSAATENLLNCTVALSWDDADPICGSDVLYNIYRSTSAGFTPGPANRIARCVAGTSFSDSVGLMEGVPYHYIVRSEDAAAGGTGPCRGGNEDTNSTVAAAVPGGPVTYGNWDDDAGDTGEALFTTGSPWSIDPAGGDTGPAAYVVPGSSNVCGDLTSPVLALGSGPGLQLSFSTVHDLEYESILAAGSVGQVEIATGPGFDDWSRLDLSPDYPLTTQFISNSCPTTQTSFVNYFAGVDMIWSTYTADLSAWAGQEIRIRFHMSGDVNFPGGNWWIDDVQVTQTAVPGSCSTAAAGPPPIPDGTFVPGTPMDVALSGSDLHVTWDAGQCPAQAVNIYYGQIGNYTTFTGGFCDLAPTGSAIISPPDDIWFLVVATDGVSTDGSFSRGPAGEELGYSGASLVCPAITQHVTNNGCP